MRINTISSLSRSHFLGKYLIRLGCFSNFWNNSSLEEINKAENIYKAWSTKPAASRSNTDAVGLIADIDLYLQEMQFRVPSGSPMHSLINSKRRIVQKMMSDISSGTPMGAGYTPTPYSNVTGYPAKDSSPFGTGKRLTGPKLTNQADKEIKGI